MAISPDVEFGADMIFDRATREPIDSAESSDLPTIAEEFEAFSKRLGLKKYGGFYVVGLFLLLVYCS